MNCVKGLLFLPWPRSLRGESSWLQISLQPSDILTTLLWIWRNSMQGLAYVLTLSILHRGRIFSPWTQSHFITIIYLLLFLSWQSRPQALLLLQNTFHFYFYCLYFDSKHCLVRLRTTLPCAWALNSAVGDLSSSQPCRRGIFKRLIFNR